MKRKLSGVESNEGSAISRGRYFSQLIIDLSQLYSECSSKHQALFQSLNLSLSHDLSDKKNSPIISKEFWNSLQILHLTDIEVYYFQQKKEWVRNLKHLYLIFYKTIISQWNELQCLKYLKKKLKEFDKLKLNELDRTTLSSARKEVSQRCREFCGIHEKSKTEYTKLDSKEIKEFYEWMKSNGAKIEKTLIVDCEKSGRGLLSQSQIQEDSSIVVCKEEKGTKYIRFDHFIFRKFQRSC